MKDVFRKFKDDQSIISIFPDESWENRGNVASYMHVGQHGGASPALIDDWTVVDRATPNEYKSLLKELIEHCEYEGLKVAK